MAVTLIYLTRNNEQLGPYPVDEIVQRVAAGEVNPDDLAWSEGREDWTSLRDILAELANEAMATTSPRPGNVAEEESDPGFFRAIGGAFFYPFRGLGALFIFIFGAVLAVMMTVIQFAGFFGLTASVILTGYYLSFLFKIIRDTAMGEKDFAEFPSLSDTWEDIFKPFIQVFFALLFCLFPAILASVFIGEDVPELAWLPTALLIGGLFYFPMVMLATAIFNSVLTALNPVLVLPAISRIFLRYLVVFLLLAGTWAGFEFMSDWMEGRLHPLAALPALSFISFYLGIIAARLLGGIYRTSAERIGWFSH